MGKTDNIVSAAMADCKFDFGNPQKTNFFAYFGNADIASGLNAVAGVVVCRIAKVVVVVLCNQCSTERVNKWLARVTLF